MVLVWFWKINFENQKINKYIGIIDQLVKINESIIITEKER